MRTKIAFLLLTSLGVFPVDAQQYIISTVAGGALPPVPIAATKGSVEEPLAVAADRQGNVYFSGANYVFKLDSSGMMSLVAGNARTGYSGDGGPADSAQIDYAMGLAVDASGNLYIADTQNHRIRKVSTGGVIATIAGTGVQGYSGDGGLASSAQIANPEGVAVDDAGNVYVADSSNNRIRKISTTGIITTVVGNGLPGSTGDGGAATMAQIAFPTGVAVDATGVLYIADAFNARIRKVSASGTITTAAGGGILTGDTGLATSAQLNNPRSISLDGGGNLYILETTYARIREVSPDGIIRRIGGINVVGYTGDGGPASSASFSNPLAIAADSTGNVYIADNGNNRIREIYTTGIVGTVAGNGIAAYSGDGGFATSAQLGRPGAVALDAAGNVYIAARDDLRIRKISTAGIITTVAGNGKQDNGYDGGTLATDAPIGYVQGVAVDANGDLYVANPYIPRLWKVWPAGIVSEIVGNGIATGSQIGDPLAVAVDAGGYLYVVDQVLSQVVKVSPTGIVTTVAGIGSAGYSGDNGPAPKAQLNNPSGVAVDASGNVFIADTYNGRIRKVTPAGIITTVAGNGSCCYSGEGPATATGLGGPNGVAVDTAGNLFVADSNRIHKVSAAGILTTIAGAGPAGYSGDGGIATKAQLYAPTGLAVDTKGNVYIADTFNNAIRVLSLPASVCGYSVSSTSLQSPISGGSFSLSLTTGTGCTWSVSGLPDWITINGSTSGAGSANVTLLVKANSGAERAAQITIAGIAVTVRQDSDTLFISSGGVVNAASYTAPVAPGSIAAIFGRVTLASPVSTSSFPVPTDLGGLSIQFGGVLGTSLFYADSRQIGGQIPWELAGQSQTTATASQGGQSSAPQTVSLAVYAPGIFTVNGGGTGQGAVLDANYRLLDASNPANVGITVVQIYCTGLGPVTHQPGTGLPSPTSPLSETIAQPTVTIGGVPASVLFSGMTPGYVGLYQVNALVPSLATKGNSVPVVISIGGVQSNIVTMAVR